MRKTTACPINQILDIISAKWTTEIIRELSIGPTRTRRFLAAIPGLTMKSLRQRLQELEKYEFIHREQLSERPPKVQYTITEKGRKLAALLAHIKAFADDLNGGSPCSCPMQEAETTQQVSVYCPERRESKPAQPSVLRVVQQ
jgi:DNA-binding HxlR family transcriptional regulator